MTFIVYNLKLWYKQGVKVIKYPNLNIVITAEWT